MYNLSSVRFMVCVSMVTLSAVATYAQAFIDLNVGLSASKSVLGVSYTAGRSQINVGLRGLGYNSHNELYIMPGIGYNHYLTKNGFYGWVAYISEYRTHDIEGLVFDPATGDFSYEIVERKGWSPGFMLTGLGKSWQFVRWGLHIDGGVATLADSRIAREWGLYLGGAASYRFHLGD